MLFDAAKLKVHYGGAEVLKGISFYIEESEVVTLIGSNGAGKTTTLRVISGLKKITEGEMRFNGKQINNLETSHIVRMGISHVPQEKELFPYMTVLENMKLGAYLRRDRKNLNRDLENIFVHFPRLKERSNQQARTLSGGEQQMLAIARALMANPKLLLLDEPSSGLSPIVVQEIAAVTRDIKKSGTSILLVEQNAQLALRIADRGYVLETGRIVMDGKCEKLLNQDGVRIAYLGG
jgi:branched-chain amino acid transport system ATP-binding protein